MGGLNCSNPYSTSHDRIVETLLQWGEPRLRDLPWRDSRDRWAVLVSEVMAQQTQVSRVIPKYLQFMAAYPTPVECAAAPLADLLSLWSGLGYPRRCKHLHDAAKRIVAMHHGVVPGVIDELRALPGIGPYTARAVLAFADESDVAVVDTNVARVLARITDTPHSARESQRIADEWLPRGRAWVWNQVLMDFGARVCTARSPRCADCPIAEACMWRGALDRPDPAQRSQLTSKPQPRFEGSDRQARGRLLRMLTQRGVPEQDVARVMQLADQPRRAAVLVESLVRDGLVVVEDGICRLP